MDEKAIKRALGAADAFALLYAAFTYPTDELVDALQDGSFVADAKSVLADMDVPADIYEPLCDRITAAAQVDEGDRLLQAMHGDYTMMYFVPGDGRKIHPYESIFKRREKNPQQRATFFLTRSTHDVERVMKKRGALPDNARREPVDFFATELYFLGHLYTGYAATLIEGDGSAWKEDIVYFMNSHAADWIPRLFQKTRETTELEIYRVLADFGTLVFDSAESALQ